MFGVFYLYLFFAFYEDFRMLQFFGNLQWDQKNNIGRDEQYFSGGCKYPFRFGVYEYIFCSIQDNNRLYVGFD